MGSGVRLLLVWVFPAGACVWGWAEFAVLPEEISTLLWGLRFFFVI